MGLSIERASLLSGLGLVQGIVERRTTVPILGHVLIEPNGNALTLSATDLEVGIRTQVACSGKEKSLTLNARKLFEIVRETEGDEVALTSLDGDWVELKCGRAKFKMMGLDPRSFPAMPSQSTARIRAGKKTAQGRTDDSGGGAGRDDRQDHLRRQSRRSPLQPERRLRRIQRGRARPGWSRPTVIGLR